MERHRTNLELRFHTDAQKTRQDKQTEILSKATDDEKFRNALISDPKATLEKELGLTLPEQLKVSIIEETADEIVLVLPYKMKDDDITQLKTFAEETHLAANNTGKTAIQFTCCC